MTDFDYLKSAFKGDIVEPSSADYAKALARWAVNSQRNARYITFPKDEADISLALKFATSNAIPVCIKCGGHNASGTSSIQDGLCIDLSRHFNTVRVDPEHKLAHVGGGAIWEIVDRATIAHGLGTPGGTVNHTGVGGLILGGGFGWLSGEHGLVIDNLVQATVVTANGSVVITSPGSHPDLFWALRGGGSNFGIVTEFVLKAHPQRRTVFAGPLIFPPALLGKLSEALDKWWPQAGDKEGAVLTLTRGPDRKPVVVLVLFFNGSEQEGRANFKHFYDLGPVAEFAAEIPYEALNSMINDKLKPGRHVYTSGTNLRSRLSLHAPDIFDRVSSMSAAHPIDASLPPFDVMVGYEFIPLKNVCAVPLDATAFHARKLHPNVMLMFFWDHEADSAGMLQHARTYAGELADIIERPEDTQPSQSKNYGYINYVSDAPLMPDKVSKFWGANYPRLQKIKKEYDPGMVFDRWFPIQPAD